MARVTDLLDLTAVGLVVASASVAAGLWAGLAAGGASCVVLSWRLSGRNAPVVA